MSNRRLTTIFVPALCLAVLAAPMAGAAEKVLRLIPERALGLAVINRLEKTDAKLTTFSQATELPIPGLLTILKARIGSAQGLDQRGSAAVALLPGAREGDSPHPVLVLPVSNYGQFIGQPEADVASGGITEKRLAGAEVLVGHVSGYAVIIKKSHRQLLQEILDSPNRPGPDVTPWEKWLGESDAAIVVTRPGIEALCKVGQEAIGVVSRRLQENKDRPEQLSDQQKQNMEAVVAVFQLYEKIPKLVSKEVGAYAAAVTIESDGSFHLTERVRLEPEGRLLGLLREVETPGVDLLAGLPAKPMVGVMAGVITEPMAKAMIDLSVGIMEVAPGLYGLDDQQMARMAEISTRSMRGVRGMSWMIGPGQPGDSLYSNMMVVITVDDAEAYLARYKETLEAMNQLTNEAESSIWGPMDVQDVSLGGRPGLKVTMAFPANAMVMMDVPNYDQLMETLFGADKKLSFYLARTGKNTVSLSYVNEALLLESIQVFQGAKPGLSADARLAETAATLPAGAQWVGYVSPKGTVDFARRLIGMLPAEANVSVQIPEFPATPPVGVAVQVAPEGLQSYTVVPAAAAKAIGQYVMQHLVRRGAAEKGQ